MSAENLKNQAMRDMVLMRCIGRNEAGWHVRGFVTKILCRCGEVRWNDGTPCQNVVGGTSANPIRCGRYPEKVQQAEDYTREG